MMGRIIACLIAAGCSLAAGASACAADLTMTPEAGSQYSVRVTSYRDLPFRTVKRQQYDFSCGSAALATLLSYHYGLNVSEAEIFKQMYEVGDKPAIQKRGFSLLDMKRYLASRGMVADGYKLPIDVLAKTQTPAITVIRVQSYKHFVVVKGLRGDQVLVGDPALGLKSYTRREFARMWDGAIFVIHDSAPRKAIFDSNAEWANIPNAPLKPALYQELSIAELTRNLPMQFQISPVLHLIGAVPP